MLQAVRNHAQIQVASAHPCICSTLQMDAVLPASYSSVTTAPHPGLQMNSSLRSRVIRWLHCL